MQSRHAAWMSGGVLGQLDGVIVGSVCRAAQACVGLGHVRTLCSRVVSEFQIEVRARLVSHACGLHLHLKFTALCTELLSPRSPAGLDTNKTSVTQPAWCARAAAAPAQAMEGDTWMPGDAICARHANTASVPLPCPGSTSTARHRVCADTSAFPVALHYLHTPHMPRNLPVCPVDQASSNLLVPTALLVSSHVCSLAIRLSTWLLCASHVELQPHSVPV